MNTCEFLASGFSAKECIVPLCAREYDQHTCQLTGQILSHSKDQPWICCMELKCAGVNTCESEIWCFEDTTREGESFQCPENFKSSYSTTGVNRDTEDAVQSSERFISSVYIGQETPRNMEVLMETHTGSSVSLSVCDCMYNQCGKLVRMTVSFDEVDSGASCSSSGDESSSEDGSYEFDCDEDFIIFDSDSDGPCYFTNYEVHLPNSDNSNSEIELKESFLRQITDIEQDYDAFVRSFNECHNKNESSIPRKLETLKGPEIYNNNIPVTGSSVNELCRRKAQQLPELSHNVSCEAQDGFFDYCKKKTVTENKSKKHVQFKQEPELVAVHSMVAWDFAYRQARIGPWERAAVDRLRFQKRIQELEDVLAPVLLTQKSKSEQI